MAKNSLMTVATPGFESMDRVVYWQNMTIAMIGSNSESMAKVVEYIKRIEKLRLETLRANLQKQKDDFISKLGSIEDIKFRLQNWNNSSPERILNLSQEFYEEIKKVVIEIKREWFNTNYKEAFLDEARRGQLNKYFQYEGLEQEVDEFRKTFKAEVKNDFNINLKNLPKKSFRVTAVAELDTQKPSDVPKITPIFEDLSPTYQGRIASVIEKISGYKFHQVLSEKSKEKMSEIFANYMNSVGISGPAYDYINKVIREQGQRFDINQSFSSIKGYIGEVYWTAFWRYITNDKYSISPTGTSRITSNINRGQQIPIDIFLDDLGIQVKNYSLKDITGGKGVIFKNYKPMQLNNFISKRLELPALANSFEHFMFSYGYNRVLDDDHAKTVYGPVYDRFKNILDGFDEKIKTLATSRLDKILQVDREFSFDSELDIVDPSAFETRYNTVFLIGNNIVFSVDIVNKMIQGIDKGEILIHPEFDITLTTNPPDVGGVYPDPVEYNPNGIMKQNKIQYSIEINVEKLATDLLTLF